MRFLAALAIVIVQFGTRVEAQRSTPLFAAVVGDTRRGEREAAYFQQFFGINAVNGTIWIRDVDGAWSQIELRRPAIEGVRLFADHPERFRSTRHAAPPFRVDLARVDYVVRYYVGGAKIYFKPGTTREAAARAVGAGRLRDVRGDSSTPKSTRQSRGL